MLEHLDVRGLGIIDTVVLELSPGFVALTGETGAGKSLLVESLKLLSGQRAQTDLVRTGDDRLRVEGVFSVEDSPQLASVLGELGVDCDGSLVIRRELSAEGRGRCWVNDVTVTAGALQRLAPLLLAIHGQHESHGLGDGEVQRRLVDDFGAHHPLVHCVGEAFDAWIASREELQRLQSAQAARRDRLDVIAYQLTEIDTVNPRSGEDEELRTRRQILRHAVRLMELSEALLDALSTGDDPALDRLARAERQLADMMSCGLELGDSRDRVVEARVLVEEVVRSIHRVTEGVDEDPDELDGLESRLFQLEQLMLKYGDSLDAVLAHREQLIAEREELAAVGDRLRSARQRFDEALALFAARAEELDGSRRDAAELLAAEVAEILHQLAMPGARLAFRWSCADDPASPLLRNGRPVGFTRAGVAQCELDFAANPGEDLRPMSRVASGGELSRLHLAIRTVLRRRHGGGPRTLLFDEVDNGLGGATAAALAELLADLAAHDQVLVVTHLAQVAARAGHHLKITKVPAEGRAVTRVEQLDRSAREGELARMVAGNRVTDAALRHARELLG